MAVPLRPAAARSRPGQPPTLSVYREYQPDPAVNAAVACTWQAVAGWPRSMRLLPDGCLDLVWDGQHARAIRPAARPVRRQVGETAIVTGIRIRVGWAAAVSGIPARDLPDVADLADLWGQAPARRLQAALAAAATPAECRTLLTGAVARRLADSNGPHPAVLAAVRLLGEPTGTAGDAARRSGLSPRHMRRLFDDHVGLPPKTLQTVLRFQRFRAWGQVAGRARIPLGRAAADCGYFDHAHLCRDCARLAGVTPSTLLHEGRPQPSRQQRLRWQ
jgi:AraC-like DNA-binding protein